MMLAGGNHLKLKGKHARARSSSASYEESDDEPAREATSATSVSTATTGVGETFSVEAIVDHVKLNKGETWRVKRDLTHAFDVNKMEQSPFNYAFRVRWVGYSPNDDTWEPIENFDRELSGMMEKYCAKNGIKLPKNYRKWMMKLSDSEEEKEKEKESKTEKAGTSKPITAQKRIDPLFDTSSDEDKRKKEKKREKEGKSTRELSPGSEERRRKKKEERKKREELDKERKKKEEEEEERERRRKKKERKEKKLREEAEKKEKEEKEKKGKEKEEKEKKEKEKEEKEKKGKEKEENEMKKKEKEEKEKKEKEKEEKEKKEMEEKARKERKKKEREEREEKERKEKEKVEKKQEEQKKGKKEEEKEKEKEEKKEKKEEEKESAASKEKEKKIEEDPKKKEEEEERKRKRKEKRELERKAKEHVKALEEEELLKKATKHMKKMVEEENQKKIRRESRSELDSPAATKNSKRPQDAADPITVDLTVSPSATPVQQPAAAAGADDPLLLLLPYTPELEEQRREAAVRRFDQIEIRIAHFDVLLREKERSRREEQEKREGDWRKMMIERGKMRRNVRIKDEPFNLQADERETDSRNVRTLRRSLSSERLPSSFRRLSSLPSMDEMRGGQSLMEALVEGRGRGEKASRLRALNAARERAALYKILGKREQAERRRSREAAGESVPEDDPPAGFDRRKATEAFIRQTLDRMRREEGEKEERTEMISLLLQMTRAYCELDYEGMAGAIVRMEKREWINRSVLNLLHHFSPLHDLTEAEDGCREACDEGEHRRCRMLLTLLMALSDDRRMGEGYGEDGPSEHALPPNTLYDARGAAAPCQMRAMMRGGCTFDDYYDEEGRNAAHKMMEEGSMIKLSWLIERGLDVCSAVLPFKTSDLLKDTYDKPWRLLKENNEKVHFMARLHAARLADRSVHWAKAVDAMKTFSLRPLTVVHTINPAAYVHRFATVTLLDKERKDYNPNDAVVLAVHAAAVSKGRGLRRVERKQRVGVPDIAVPYFLIERALDTYETESYECQRARLTVHDLGRPEAAQHAELTRLGDHATTTVFRVPKKLAQLLIASRRFTETHLKLISPPEHSVILAQFFVIPFKAEN